MIKNNGFKAFPVNNTAFTGYAKIGLAFMAFYVLGGSYCMNKFGDENQFNYLRQNKRAIMRGDASWDAK